MKKDETSIIKVLGFALALPSSILGVFFLIYYLISQGIISTTVGLLLIIAIIFYSFYMMYKYAKKK